MTARTFATLVTPTPDERRQQPNRTWYGEIITNPLDFDLDNHSDLMQRWGINCAYRFRRLTYLKTAYLLMSYEMHFIGLSEIFRCNNLMFYGRSIFLRHLPDLLEA